MKINKVIDYFVLKQELWANAHQTRDSISLILDAGCLRLSPVYFGMNLLQVCVAAWNSKKCTKNPYFGVQGRSMSSILVPQESSSAVLVMIRSKFVSICNRSFAWLVDSSIIRVFWRRYPNLMHSHGGLLVPRGSKLALLKSTFSVENLFRLPVVLVYFEWFRRNLLLKCVSQAEIAKNLLKTCIFGVQGCSRLSMLVPPERSSAVVVMISSKSVSVCNLSQASRANSGKITIS